MSWASGTVAIAAALLTGVTSPATAAGSWAANAAWEDPDIDKATDLYNEGIEAQRAGNIVSAAEKFSAALVLIPADEIEIRAAVLFDLVAARREAFKEDGEFRHLCAARDALTDYIDESEAAEGKKAREFTDVKQARSVRGEVLEQMHLVERDSPEATCDEPAGEPEAEGPLEEPAEQPAEEPKQGRLKALDKQSKTFLIAGGATAGVGLIFYGLMFGGLAMGRKAERDGEALVQMGIDTGVYISKYDPRIEEIQDRGRAGNSLAIAGGVIGTLATGAGVALIVLAFKRPDSWRKSGVARRGAPLVSPYLSPGSRGVGATLRLNF